MAPRATPTDLEIRAAAGCVRPAFASRAGWDAARRAEIKTPRKIPGAFPVYSANPRWGGSCQPGLMPCLPYLQLSLALSCWFMEWSGRDSTRNQQVGACCSPS